VPVLGAFRFRFAFEFSVRVPTIPPLDCAVVKITVTPAAPLVQVVHSRVLPPPPGPNVRSPSVIQ